MTLHRSTCIPAPEFSHRETKEPVPPQGTLERLLLRTEQTGWSVVYISTVLTLELEVESDERSFRGRAASTDIIEASAVAYVNAVTEIPPRGLLGPAHARGLAFLYAESDIPALIGAARSLAPSGGLRPHTYTTLIGLLACTGLRITEALTLRADDVDLSAGVLTIRQTKFRKSRLVPLHTSAVAPLRDYTAD